MRVRKFRIGDEAALLKVFYSAVHQIARRDYSPEQIQAWAPPDLDAGIWEAHMRGIDPFVVEENGHIIAYTDLQANGYIDHFFVSGDHPRQGAGRLLMEAMHARASACGLETLSSDVSRTAQPFFEHFGFNVVEQRLPQVRGVIVPNAFMRKVLSTQGA